MSITRTLSITLVGLGIGCKKDEAPAPAPAAQATQTAAAAKPAPAKPAAKPTKPLPAAAKTHAVPGEWIEMSHQAKGFGFHVPAGTTDSNASKDGFDLYTAKLPAPHDKVMVLVAAYKDHKKTKEDLLTDVSHVIEATGGKDIKKGDVKELSPDYSLADYTFTSDGKPVKVRALVATDVTDNYLMLVGTAEDHFKASEETIDTIWGSFDMYSGGSTGENH